MNNKAALDDRPRPKRTGSLLGNIERIIDITKTVPKLNIAEP